MGIFDNFKDSLDKFKDNNIASRIMEEKLYNIVGAELEQGIKRNGLWIKALANSKGDEVKAMSLYIEYRVQSIIDEEEIKRAAVKATEEATKAVEEAEESKRKLEEKARNTRAIRGIPDDIEAKIKNDGFSFLSSIVVRKNGTFDDYSVERDENKIYLIKDDKVEAEYEY